LPDCTEAAIPTIVNKSIIPISNLIVETSFVFNNSALSKIDLGN
jgi:hypothetical protein